MADKGAALSLARKRKKEKQNAQNQTRVGNLNAKKRKLDEQQDIPETFRRIIDLNTLVWQLKDGCIKCNKKPLLLTNVDFDEKCSFNRLAVICGKCQKKNFLTLHSQEVEEKMVLGALQTGQGFSHLDAFMAIVGLPCFAGQKFKLLERKVGKSIETVAIESCEKWREEEKNIESENPDSKLTGAYDTSWSKRGGGYNALSGRGTVIGVNTGKCIDFGIKNKHCRTCLTAEKKDIKPQIHDCRKNFSGTAKSMEAAICEDLFKKEDYKVMIGDEDSSAEARLRSTVNPDLEKWSDKNHVLRTLGKILLQNKSLTFGAGNSRLTDKVIEYITSNFSTALNQNKGDPEGLQKTLKSIVPHAFGKHEDCGKWCEYNSNPKTYKHKNLQDGKDLCGDGLKNFLEEALEPFMTDPAVKKLAPLGSTQRNECLNHVVASKNLKIRFYGSSESSDFRTAAAVAQFNESYPYLISVSQKLEHKTCIDELRRYVAKYNFKREQQAKRQKTTKYKIARKTNRAKRKQKDKTKGKQEGTSYEPGIGFTDSNAPFIQSILASPEDPKEILKWLKCRPVNFLKKPKYAKAKTDKVTKILFYDLETSGFATNADILQVSIIEADSDGPDSYLSLYIMPKKKIDPSSTKIHGFSINYSTGKKSMVDKDGRILQTVTLEEAAEKVTRYLKAKMDTNVEQLLLVAHNGHSFDQNRFIAFMDKSGILSCLEDKIYFGDSYQACKKVLKETSDKFKLIDVHNKLYPNEKFVAHDSLEDVKALKRICSHPNYSRELNDEFFSNSRQLTSIRHKMSFDKNEKISEQKISSFLKLDHPAKKLAKLGLTSEIDSKNMWSKFGAKLCISFFVSKGPRAKLPRITGDVKELCKIQRILEGTS